MSCFAIGGALVVAQFTGAGALSGPANGCPPAVGGASLGALTYEQIADLPQTQLAIGAGFLTRDDAIAGYMAFDENGDGLLCVSFPPGWNNTRSKKLLVGLDEVPFINIADNGK